MDYKIIIPSKDRLKLITTHAIEFLIKYNLFYTKEIFIFVNIDDFESYHNLFEDFDKYMKNVVNKVIKPEIKNLPRGKECVHSIVFRYRKNLDDIEIQIHPRYRTDCTESYWNRFDTYAFEKEIQGILSNYGWVKGVNYQTSTYRD